MTPEQTRQLREITARIDEANSACQHAWAAFDVERNRVRVSVDWSKNVPDEQRPGLRKLNELHSEYESTADRLEELQGTRNALWSDMAERSPRSSAGRAASGEVGPGEWLHAELHALTGGAGLGDAVTPTEYVSYFFDRLAAASVGLASGFTVIDTDRQKVAVPHVTDDPAADWTDEGDELPLSDPAGATIEAVPRKLGVVTSITNEVFNDSEPAALALAEQTIIRSLALSLDHGFYEGSGTSPEVRGLKNVSGIQEVSMGTNGAALASFDPFADALSLLEAENAPGPYAVAMHPRSFRAARKLKDDTGRPLLTESPDQATPYQLWGAPVFLSAQLAVNETQGSATTASSAYVYSPPQVVAVRRQDTEVTVDPLFDLRRELIGVRATTRWDLVVPNPKAVVRVRGLLPS